MGLWVGTDFWKWRRPITAGLVPSPESDLAASAVASLFRISSRCTVTDILSFPHGFSKLICIYRGFLTIEDRALCWLGHLREVVLVEIGIEFVV